MALGIVETGRGKAFLDWLVDYAGNQPRKEVMPNGYSCLARYNAQVRL